ncbi:MAG TPA: V-type ATP synthase subunit E [Thermodesulfovibrionales bacterium]|nr:V-type ATP synthase subunit E [Thermodesulfovibrionales bacterium]
MGYRELIESLRKAADERVRSIWQEAETEAEKIRNEGTRKAAQVRDEYAAMEGTEAEATGSAVIFDALNRSRMYRLTSEKRLSDRLFALAASCLSPLRDEGYGENFEVIVKELPLFPWKTVRVNPRDVGLARENFPDAEIVSDEGITGGVDAETEEGKVRVIDTFEKRLERAWVEILPALTKEIYEEAERRGTA